MRNIWNLLAACVVVSLLGLAAPAAAAAEEGPVVSFSDAGPVDLSGSEPEPAHPNIGERVTVGSVELPAGDWVINASGTLTVEHPDNKHVGWCTLYVRDGRLDAQSDPPNPDEVGRAAGRGGSSSIWDAADDDGHRHAHLDLLQAPDWTSPIVIETTDETTTVDMECAVNDNRPADYGIYASDVAITARPLVTPDPPTTTDQTCEQAGTVTLPDNEGVVWSIGGAGVESGTSQAAPGEYYITAMPTEGYTFGETEIFEWNVEIKPSVEACVGPDGPQGPDGPAGSDGEDGTDGEDGITTVDTTKATSSESLPKTGAPGALMLAALAGGLLLSGAGLVGVDRLRARRR